MTMNNPFRFSIVVPFFNESAKLAKTIDALVKLDWAEDNYEIILVDNMSSDDSMAIAKRSLASFSNARVISCTDFRSSYAARNVGWKAAQGKYIVFIDADCIADRYLLAAYDKAISADAADEIGIFAGGVGPYSRLDLTSVERFSADRKMLNQDSAVKGWAYRPFAQTANAVFPRSILEAVNGFNPQMTSGGDGELCWRIIDKTAKRIEYCSEAYVSHWHRESIRDLFSQFEKYGVGRFQQCGVVPNFDKGLIGVTKDVILERFEKLEKEIIAKTTGDDQKSLLWALYDTVCSVGNSIGYIGSKSLIATLENNKNIFSPPSFTYSCTICGAANLNKTPTFASGNPENTTYSICCSCDASLENRLLYKLNEKTETSHLKSNEFSFIPFNIDSIEHTDDFSQSQKQILTIRGPEALAQCLIAMRLACETKMPLLITYNVISSERHITLDSEMTRSNALHQSGYFFDEYTGAVFFFETINL